MKRFEEKSVGRCLTEYKHINYDQLVDQSEAFVKVSQFVTKPTLDDVIQNRLDSHNEIPRCSYGEIIHCLIKGRLIEIYSIIDSSD